MEMQQKLKKQEFELEKLRKKINTAQPIDKKCLCKQYKTL
jgi:hypothetical protein